MTTTKTMSNAKMSYRTLINQWTTVLLIALFSAAITGCNKDKDEEMNPQERLPFLGKYEMIDKNNNHGDGTFKYKLNITTSSKGVDKVELEGFRYVNNGVYATIKGEKMIIAQVIGDGDERVEINGEGKLESNILTYSYVLKYKEKGKQEEVYENSVVATRIE
jgi:hypothetical protein